MESPAASEDLRARRDRLLGPAYRLFYDEPLHLVAGEGAWLTAADGRRFLDCYNNVPHVGHCRAEVVDALARQAAQLNTHTRYLHEAVVDYAERLLALFPPELDTVMFCCTGSEANELALRIAREVTGRRGVVVTDCAYHGNSQATAEISTEDTPPARRPPHVATVPHPDPLRQPDAAGSAGAQFDSARRSLEAAGEAPAAFITDTICSAAGVIEPPPGWLRQSAAAARAAGALFIADEVQPGLGRTGRHTWGFEADGVVPDLVTLGKPLGNGYPLAAVVARREFVERFAAQAHYFNTFGGNPVAAATGLAVLEVLQRDGLQAHAQAVGAALRAGIETLARDYSSIGDVRGHGLFLGVDIVAGRDSHEADGGLARRLVHGLKDRGVLAGSCGPAGNVLKLRPPMVFSSADAELLLMAFAETLAACDAH